MAFRITSLSFKALCAERAGQTAGTAIHPWLRPISECVIAAAPHTKP